MKLHHADPLPPTCATCNLYRHSREETIRAEIAKTTNDPTLAEQKWRRFMAGVHERHTVLTVGRVVALMAVVGELIDEEESA